MNKQLEYDELFIASREKYLKDKSQYERGWYGIQDTDSSEGTKHAGLYELGVPGPASGNPGQGSAG
jgi:hypothetical protein